MMLLALSLLVLASLAQAAEQEREFYVIAHMVNNEAIVRWAMRSGANALEIDVQFDQVTGSPADVHHGVPCDCTCYLDLFSGSVCDLPAPCTGHVPHTEVFTAIMEDIHLDNLALIYIDSKTSELNPNLLHFAGTAMIAMLEAHLFREGYQGRVLIGTGQKEYINSVVESASASSWRDQIYVTYDMFDETMEAIDLMARLPYPNKIFSIGLTACSPNQYYSDTTLGAINKAKGLISDVYAWTVDSEASWNEYYVAGARGIITNYVHNMLQWVSRKGLKLAKPAKKISLFPMKSINWNKNGPWDNADELLITDIGTCSCEYHSGGCSITVAAPVYSACRCLYNGFWKCSGQVVGCDSDDSSYCETPDTSIQSCVEGGGDCGGYINTDLSCDCQWGQGGCSVYNPAPAGYACKCSYDKFWMCSGSLTSCRDPHSEFCKSPDASIYSCLQGKGNCGGYYYKDCSCEYGPGGCTITKPAIPDAACYCQYMGAWTCAGTLVNCLDNSAEKCKNPDMSIASCVQGGGSCGAYEETCDCKAVGVNGCVISKPSPAQTACKCHMDSLWNKENGCYGEIVMCGIPHSDTCDKPDRSLDSCLQGGGNCRGYEHHRILN